MDHKALANWAIGRNVGASSRCMARHFMGMETDGSYPSDGGDFERCEGLLEAVPGLRDRLPEMAKVNRYWAALVPRWDEIREAETAKRYDLMKSILNPIEDDDPGIIRLGPGATLRFGTP